MLSAKKIVLFSLLLFSGIAVKPSSRGGESAQERFEQIIIDANQKITRLQKEKARTTGKRRGKKKIKNPKTEEAKLIETRLTLACIEKISRIQHFI